MLKFRPYPNISGINEFKSLKSNNLMRFEDVCMIANLVF